MGLRELRNNKGLTLEEVADLMNVKMHTIHKWETGKVMPHPKNIRKLAKFYKVKITDIRQYIQEASQIEKIKTITIELKEDNDKAESTKILHEKMTKLIIIDRFKNERNVSLSGLEVNQIYEYIEDCYGYDLSLLQLDDVLMAMNKCAICGEYCEERFMNSDDTKKYGGDYCDSCRRDL